MSELKTKPRPASVEKFLGGIKNAQTNLDMMKKAARAEPRMWGSSIVGFGEYHYAYDSGHEGDWFMLGFSPRAQQLTLYFMSGLEGHGPLMEKLGQFKTGKSCLCIKRLAGVQLPALRRLMVHSVKAVREHEARDGHRKNLHQGARPRGVQALVSGTSWI